MASINAVIIRVWASILSVIFLLVMILGIISIFFISSLRGVGIGITIFGFFGLVLCIFGCVGAGFEKEGEEQQRNIFFIVCFFGGMVILHVLFVVFGVALICLQPSIKMIACLPTEDFDTIFGSLPKLADDVVGTINKLKNFALGVGIFLIILSVIIIITLITTLVRMGKELFTKNFMISFSTIEVVLGFSIAAFLLFLNFSREYAIFGEAIGTKVIVPVIVFGFLLGIVGIIGFIATCVGNKVRCISLFFSTGNIVVFLGFLVLFILSIVLHNTISDWSRSVCEGSDSLKTYCDEIINRTNDNRCKKSSEEQCGDYGHDAFVDDLEEMVQSVVIVIMFVCLYLVLFLLFVIIATYHNCYRHGDENYDDGTSKLKLLRSPQTQFLDDIY